MQASWGLGGHPLGGWAGDFPLCLFGQPLLGRFDTRLTVRDPRAIDVVVLMIRRYVRIGRIVWCLYLVYVRECKEVVFGVLVF